MTVMRRRSWRSSSAAPGIPEVAVDILAETFAVALVGRRRFRGRHGEAARAWLFGIARHRSGRPFSARRRAATRPRSSWHRAPPVDRRRVRAHRGARRIRGNCATALPRSSRRCPSTSAKRCVCAWSRNRATRRSREHSTSARTPPVRASAAGYWRCAPPSMRQRPSAHSVSRGAPTMPDTTDRFEHLAILQEVRDELIAAAHRREANRRDTPPACVRGCRVGCTRA